jgi:hypothetical protein
MLSFPDEPAVPEGQRATGAMPLRYSDVSQDGRLKLEAIPHGFGPVLWQHLLQEHPAVSAARARGIMPILTRLTFEGGADPIQVTMPLTVHGSFQLAHTTDAHGAVDRLILTLWLDVFGERGRLYGPPPAGAGETVRVGRGHAVHVFTRPFAPPPDRKVLRFDLPGLPPVPPERHVWRAPEAILELPEGAEPLDAEPAPDPASLCFGVGHTDSNQHVSSFVYPRLFEDAALRRFAAYGNRTALLARHAEIGFRKPCLAGDRARVLVRAFRLGDALGATFAVVLEEGAPSPAQAQRPACYARMLFDT